MSFFVMIAGCGASMFQQFGLPVYVGGILMGILATLTVIMGLGKIVDVIGKIGPAIVVLSIVLGVASIAKNPEGLTRVNEVLPSLDIMSASSNWLFAAGSYVGFCMLWLASFMGSLGATANSKKEASLGAMLGAVAFSIAVAIITLGLLANITEIYDSQVPSLILAGNIHPYMAIIFSVIVIAGIYTTAVPLLWTVSSRIAKDGSKNFKIVTVILAVLGVVIGLLIPFNKLVNVVYVINGYVGVLLLVMMVIKSVAIRMKKNQPKIIAQQNEQ